MLKWEGVTPARPNTGPTGVTITKRQHPDNARAIAAQDRYLQSAWPLDPRAPIVGVDCGSEDSFASKRRPTAEDLR